MNESSRASSYEAPVFVAELGMFRIVGLLLIAVGGAIATLNLFLYPRAQTRRSGFSVRGALSTAMFAAGVGIAIVGLKLAAADLSAVDLTGLPSRGGGFV